MNINHARTYELIKTGIKQNLKEYDKVINYNEEDVDFYDKQSLENKFKKIDEKLTQMQELKKNNFKKDESKKAKDKLKSNILYDLSLEDDYRAYNIFIPKIKINETSQNKSTFVIGKNMFDDNLFDDSLEREAEDNRIIQSEFRFKKLDKIQKHKQDPMFFSNRFIEYTYNNCSEKDNSKRRKNGEVIYSALKKKIEENIVNSLYNVNPKNPVFKVYNELQKLEEASKITDLDDFRLKEEDLIYEPKEEQEEIEKKLKKEKTISLIDISNLETNKDKAYVDANNKFRKWFLSESALLKKRAPSNVNNNTNTHVVEKTGMITGLFKNMFGNSHSNNVNDNHANTFKVINFNANDTNYEDSTSKIKKEERYEPNDITFGISIEGIIDKRIRKTIKYHLRSLLVEGPLAKWYRFEDEFSTETLKGFFDIRKNRFAEKISDKAHSNPSPIDGNSKKDDFKVTHFFEKGGEEINNAELDFKSDYFKEFSGKSFKDVFEQIRKYYITLNTLLKVKTDYSKLKYLSDSFVKDYHSTAEMNKNILDNLEWHLKLKSLSLKGIDKIGMNKLFGTLANSDIRLEELSIEAVISANSSSQFEFDSQNVKNYFSKSSCSHLTTIHLINLKFENGIKNLFDSLSLKFNYVKKKLDKQYLEVMSEEALANVVALGSIEIPYRNISIRKTAPNAYPYVICLNELYSFFNKMATSFGGIDKFTTPFNCLDLSGSDTMNLDGLKNLINNFKIINDLNLSNTKLVSEKIGISQSMNNIRSEKIQTETIVQQHHYLINNLDFLKSVTLKHHLSDSKDSDLNFNKKIVQSGFDYSYGLTPLLKNIYLYETPINLETFTELLLLFRVKYILIN